VCKIYMHDFLKSAIASVCLRLEGFKLFCIAVARQIEPVAILAMPPVDSCLVGAVTLSLRQSV
jgi:hypothetical protein